MAPPKKINLALQGGGAHGAYSWGVLDRLLEEDNLLIEGISGTSAGAMNGAMLVNGYIKDGRAGAKHCLEQFWRKVSDAAAYSPLHQTPLDRMLTGFNMDLSLPYHVLDFLTRIVSPYQLNPFNFNPMHSILREMLDLDAMHANSPIKLFVAATHVASGQARVFNGHEITADVLLASACIPLVFQAVEIQGEHYWDGGYMGNPALWPLIYHCKSEDVLLVQITPIYDEKLPKTTNEIVNRLNEIAFNSSLIAEMRSIDFVSRLLKQGSLDPKRYKDMRIHLISSPEQMHDLNASSKANADWEFFTYLKSIGYTAAEQWLKTHWHRLGVESSIDIHKKFLSGPGTQPEMSDFLEKRPEQDL